jgi:hypothetical protein
MIALPVRGRDAEAQLIRRLLSVAGAAGLAMTADRPHARPWASATFAGMQVSLVLAAPRSPALGRWVADLPLAELPLRGHLVASVAIDSIEDDGATVRIAITALVIEEVVEEVIR